MARHIFTGSGAPLTTPTGVGHHYVDVDTKTAYISTGTDSAADWKVDASSGDMTGPNSATDNAFALFDGTTGKILKNSNVTDDGSGNMTAVSDTHSSATASRAAAYDGSKKLVSSTTTATELGYVSGVTSAIQTQLNAKEASITVLPISKGGTNSGAALSNNRVAVSSGGAIVEAAAITASRALASDANGIPVAVATTATELGYVNGVTAAIQTQLDKALVDPHSIVYLHPKDTTIPIVPNVEAPKTYLSFNNVKLDGGSMTVTFQINGVSITGLTNLSITTTPQNFTATAANVAALNTAVTMIITNTILAYGFSGTLRAVRT